ncbi:uncharacterized protein DFL_005480 [Arthrobotrys flagrans]|uniref:SGNH hydrolase-type esterase domain-containing protein n=1 Tax=Arthrobotrys flagrans TaxID=97331 RepID=A0A436ZXK0_ARTFL|nr:hypothetical protein DFL_005480 [Arthrobotrys flagrans]
MHISIFLGLIAAALAQSVAEATEFPPSEPSAFVTSRIPTSIPLGATFTRSKPETPIPSGPPLRHWFSFGDSYTSTNFSINGIQPSIERPLGNPPAADIWHKQTYNATWIPYITTKFNKSVTLNYNLARKVREFRSEHPVSTIRLIDSYNIIKNINEEQCHGVKNGVWADRLHIKTQVHKVLAKEIAKVLESVAETPINGTVGGTTSLVPTSFEVPTPTMGHGSAATSGTLW